MPASIEGLIKLRPVSMSGHTFLEYTTSFSNDVSAERIEDQKWKKLELFKSTRPSLLPERPVALSARRSCLRTSTRRSVFEVKRGGHSMQIRNMLNAL